jgi:hypothetical protein
MTTLQPNSNGDRFPVGARFTSPAGTLTVVDPVTPTADEFIQDRTPAADYVMRTDLGATVRVTHEFLTSAVGVERILEAS